MFLRSIDRDQRYEIGKLNMVFGKAGLAEISHAIS